MCAGRGMGRLKTTIQDPLVNGPSKNLEESLTGKDEIKKAGVMPQPFFNCTYFTFSIFCHRTSRSTSLLPRQKHLQLFLLLP